ncbi:restriction endonuclease [Thermomonospora umbrina]|uniref:Restriction system protein n=1 Tax=Thermomonospora umbrina TaxID=111806 RepID=A0A3D9SX41_9ACTN|nr:restriction endonuclease [Thermomonospora umbrina]REF00520.1 restriction system protein [Thermomonospora umbrina]
MTVWLLMELITAVIGLVLSVWWGPPVTAAAGAAAVTLQLRARSAVAADASARLAELRYTAAELDALSPLDFELAVRDLMVRDGLAARHVGRGGDQAADVIATDPATGRTVVVQCKHTTTGRNVTVEVIYQVNGTAGPVHGADMAVVVTNGGFTKDARLQAAAFRIVVVDRGLLQRWAQEGTSIRGVCGLDGPVRARRFRVRRPSTRRPRA